MNIESNNISQSRRKGPHDMAVALHACFVTGKVAFYVKAQLCRSQSEGDKNLNSFHSEAFQRSIHFDKIK